MSTAEGVLVGQFQRLRWRAEDMEAKKREALEALIPPPLPFQAPDWELWHCDENPCKRSLYEGSWQEVTSPGVFQRIIVWTSWMGRDKLRRQAGFSRYWCEDCLRVTVHSLWRPYY
jgi:hypothetical protein